MPGDPAAATRLVPITVMPDARSAGRWPRARTRVRVMSQPVAGASIVQARPGAIEWRFGDRVLDVPDLRGADISHAKLRLDLIRRGELVGDRLIAETWSTTRRITVYASDVLAILRHWYLALLESSAGRNKHCRRGSRQRGIGD